MSTEIRQVLPSDIRDALLAGSAPNAGNPFLTASAAAATYYPLTNPAGYITAGGLTGYVPYTGATASLDMGFNNIVTGGITSANQRELRAGTSGGAGNGFVDIGSYPASPNYGALYINQTVPGANNYTLLSDGSTDLSINVPTTSSNLNILRGNTSYFLQCYGDQVGGVDPSFLFSPSDRTSIPAGTAYIAYAFGGSYSNYLWQTGTVPYFFNAYIFQQIVSAVGPSTFSYAYGLYVEAPGAGLNATITNNYAAGFDGNVLVRRSLTSTISLQNWVGVAGVMALYFNKLTPSVSNYVLAATAASTYLNGNAELNFLSNNSLLLKLNKSIGTRFAYTAGSLGGLTASTEANAVLWTTGSTQWATGAIATQREFYITSPTYSFVAASTITNAYTLYVAAPTAGTNATITNKYAAGLAGNLHITTGGDTIYMSGGTNTYIWGATNMRIKGGAEVFIDANGVAAVWRTTNTLMQWIDGLNMQVGTTAGTKIGTATTQKLGFWNVTPIVQPTTGVTSATFVANAGTAVNDASTFDGYTMGQVVKALRNTGLLA